MEKGLERGLRFCLSRLDRLSKGLSLSCRKCRHDIVVCYDVEKWLGFRKAERDSGEMRTSNVTAFRSFCDLRHRVLCEDDHR